MQVTSCEWNAEHPKWFPPGSTGNKVMLIAAVAKQSESQFHIATLDVTGLVQGIEREGASSTHHHPQARSPSQ